jgi:hypothetical protein
MLNGSKRDAPASNRARLVAISPAASPSAEEAEAGAAKAVGTPIQSDPKWTQWLLIPTLTLLSALVGGAAAWLVQ